MGVTTLYRPIAANGNTTRKPATASMIHIPFDNCDYSTSFEAELAWFSILFYTKTDITAKPDDTLDDTADDAIPTINGETEFNTDKHGIYSEMFKNFRYSTTSSSSGAG